MKYFKILSISLLVLSFLACEKESKSGVSTVHWDRDMCARCVMVVSDRQNTVQIQHPKTGKSYMFDDIGCMALWFKEEKIDWEKEAIIWITDVNSGEWIDARTAYYNTGNVTPMAYGYSAHKTKNSIKAGEEIIDYAEVLKRVLDKG